MEYTLNMSLKTANLLVINLQTAVDEANRTNAYGFFSGMLIDPVNPCLVIVVRRESIVQDTLVQITKHGPYDLKKPLKVRKPVQQF